MTSSERNQLVRRTIAEKMPKRMCTAYQADPVALLTAVAPQLAERLPDDRVKWRVELAADPDCPPAVLGLLAADRPTVLVELAQNPASTALVLDRVAERVCTYPSTQHVQASYQLARNPKTPERVLRRLSPEFNHELVERPDCPMDLLIRMAYFGHWSLRARALRTGRLPTPNVLVCVTDHNPAVAHAARQSVARRGTATIRQAMLLMNPRSRRRLAQLLKPKQLRTLADDPDPVIRYAIAASANDAELLCHLASDPHGRVRRAASNRVLRGLAG